MRRNDRSGLLAVMDLAKGDPPVLAVVLRLELSVAALLVDENAHHRDDLP